MNIQTHKYYSESGVQVRSLLWIHFSSSHGKSFFICEIREGLHGLF